MRSQLLRKHHFMFNNRTKMKKLILLIEVVFVAGGFMFVYQAFVLYYMVSNEIITNRFEPTAEEKKLVLGTNQNQQRYYNPENANFTCLYIEQVIDFAKVNDNYCDCADNTDEPGTNACMHGEFYCTIQQNFKLKRIHSSKVNDGICDCCDGSDEYANNKLIAMDRELQRKMNRFLVPCPFTCEDNEFYLPIDFAD